MKSIREASKMLREMAAELDECQENMTPREENLDINAAAQQLRLLLGENYFSIELELSYHFFDKNPSVKWVIYDGEKFHDGNTLAAALDHVRDDRKAEPEGDPVAAIRDVQEALNPVPSLTGHSPKESNT